jgi:hypothetical protein
MKTTIRNLAVAAPLAFAALTMAPVPAFASDPVIVMPPIEPQPAPTDIALPTPKPDPEPQVPQGPDEIALPEPGPVGPQGPDDIAQPEPGPVGPDDLTNPEPEPTLPDGPDDLTAPEQCPTHGVECGGQDQPEKTPEEGPGEGADEPGDAFDVPTRIDTGLGDTDAAAFDGATLALLLAGGTLLTVSGAAFVARNRSRRTA